MNCGEYDDLDPNVPVVLEAKVCPVDLHTFQDAFMLTMSMMSYSTYPLQTSCMPWVFLLLKSEGWLIQGPDFGMLVPKWWVRDL